MIRFQIAGPLSICRTPFVTGCTCFRNSIKETYCDYFFTFHKDFTFTNYYHYIFCVGKPPIKATWTYKEK